MDSGEATSPQATPVIHLSLIFYSHRSAGVEHQLTVSHHGLSGLHTLLDHRHARGAGTWDHRAHVHGEVGLDDKDVLALLTGLNGLRRNYDRVGLRSER